MRRITLALAIAALALVGVACRGTEPARFGVAETILILRSVDGRTLPAQIGGSDVVTSGWIRMQSLRYSLRVLSTRPTGWDDSGTVTVRHDSVFLVSLLHPPRQTVLVGTADWPNTFMHRQPEGTDLGWRQLTTRD